MLPAENQTALAAASERVQSTRERIDALEDGIRKELKPVDCPVVHRFSKGVYAREMFIPAGTVVTGKIHKHENLNILSKGSLSILMEDGSTQRVQAPYTVVSPPGTRRCAFAHEDSVWTTVLGTDSRDVDEIEAAFVAQTPDEFQLFCEQQLALEVA